MPKGKPPLSPAEVDHGPRAGSRRGPSTTRRPTPASRYDKDHPPIYSRPPVITALDFSPDGTLLAVGGFHEVLLWKADGSELVARLVGLSERIESVRFSPDGDAAGRHRRPARPDGRGPGLGRRQEEARPVGPGHRPTPSTARAGRPTARRSPSAAPTTACGPIDAKTGEQVLFMGSHNDWVLDTAFSADGSHLISVGRDMAAKLTEVATQRFVDNITSITPGALKGGIGAVARHPKRDEIVVGGSDGVPKVYRVFRQTRPRHRRRLEPDPRVRPPMPGRVYSVAVSADGKRIAAGSSLDGTGQVDVYSYEFDTGLPDAIKKIMSKVVTPGRPRRRRRSTSTTPRGSSGSPRPTCPGRVYAVAFRPDGKVLAAAGADGDGPPDRPRDRRGRQGVRPRAARARRRRPAGRRSRRPSTEPRGAGRGRGAARRARRSWRSRSSRPTIELEQPVRLRPARRHRPARLGRGDRRDPDGRGRSSRRASSRSRARAWSGPGPTARRRSALGLGGQDGRGPGHGLRVRRREARSISSTTSTRSSRGSAATRGPATARRRARTGSSSRSAAMTRSSTSGP